MNKLYKVGTEVKFKPNPCNSRTLRGIIVESNCAYGEPPWYKIEVHDFEKGIDKVFDEVPHYCICTIIEHQSRANAIYEKAKEAMQKYVSNTDTDKKVTYQSSSGIKKSALGNDLIPLRIIYNDPATIVFWNDHTKTVVKRMKDEPFNPYTAFCAALAKKVYGNNSQVNNIVKKGIMQKKQDAVLKEKSKKDKKAKGAKKNGSSK